MLDIQIFLIREQFDIELTLSLILHFINNLTYLYQYLATIFKELSHRFLLLIIKTQNMIWKFWQNTRCQICRKGHFCKGWNFYFDYFFYFINLFFINFILLNTFLLSLFTLNLGWYYFFLLFFSNYYFFYYHGYP